MAGFGVMGGYIMLTAYCAKWLMDRPLIQRWMRRIVAEINYAVILVMSDGHLLAKISETRSAMALCRAGKGTMRQN